MRPITTPQMRTSKRSIACVRGALSHGCLRKANWEIGVVTRVQDLPGIAVIRSVLVTPIRHPVAIPPPDVAPGEGGKRLRQRLKQGFRLLRLPQLPEGLRFIAPKVPQV